jgi:hypothetical protein
MNNYRLAKSWPEYFAKLDKLTSSLPPDQRPEAERALTSPRIPPERMARLLARALRNLGRYPSKTEDV